MQDRVGNAPLCPNILRPGHLRRDAPCHLRLCQWVSPIDHPMLLLLALHHEGLGAAIDELRFRGPGNLHVK